MSYKQNIGPFDKKLTILVGLTVVGFMAFKLALSFYRNILFEETLKNIQTQNSIIAGTIEEGYREVEYYKSAQFKDKFAKENLSKVNPGEKVLIIAENTIPTLPGELTLSEKERKEAAYFELLHQMPVIEHWQLYLFHRDRIDEIKRAL